MRNNGHRRMRGRSNTPMNGGNHNRRGPNPLTRSYESNGPDVKIRGTVQHLVEKYTSLARDAQGAGDPVMAENYFQHAEHYFRIIAAAQAQYGTPQNFQRQDQEDDGEDDGQQEEQEEGVIPADQPQPYVRDPFPQRKPFDGEQPQVQNQAQNPRYQPRDRAERQDRPDNRQERTDRPQRFPREDRAQQVQTDDAPAQVTPRSRYGMTPRNPMVDVDGEQPAVTMPQRREIVQAEPIVQRPAAMMNAEAEPELPAFLMATRRTAVRRPRPARPEEAVEANEGGEE